MLGDIPDAYTQDFYDNAQWLKLGYHGNSSTPFIEETGYQEGYDITDQALACLGAGRTNILRLHSWEASPEQKAYLKEKGIKVLLYPDDDRYGYAQNDTFEQGGLVHRRTNVWYEKMEMINEESLFIGREYVTAFTHEWCFDQQAQRIETSLKLYEDNGYTFDC